MTNCEVCGKGIEISNHGLPRRFCSEKCRSKARRGLRLAGPGEAQPVDTGSLNLGGLDERARAWVRDVTTDRKMTPTEIQLMFEAAEALSRAYEARKVIAADGIVIPSPHGDKAHPAVKIERQTSAAFVRISRLILTPAVVSDPFEPKTSVLNGEWFPSDPEPAPPR